MTSIKRWPRVLRSAATVVFIGCAACVALADTEILYDDRPVLLASEQAASGHTPASLVVDVSVEENEAGGVELVLSGDGSLAYDVFRLEGPDRLIVDLPGVRLATRQTRLELDDQSVVRVRLGQWLEEPPVARVVLDMTSPEPWQVDREGQRLRVLIGESKPAPALEAKLADAPELAAEPAPIAAADPAPEPISSPEPAAEETTPIEVAAAAAPDSVEPSAAPATPPAVERPVPQAASLRPDPEPAAPAPRQPQRNTMAEPAPINDPEPAAPAVVDLTDSVAEPVNNGAATPETTPRFESDATGEDPWSAPEVAAAIEDAVARSTSASPEPTAAPANVVTQDAPRVVRLPSFETKTIQDEQRVYTGRPITLQLVDADIKQVFGLFHELSGLNFVLDPSVAGQVTIVVDNVPWDQALDLILKNNGLDMVLEGNVVRIAPVTKLAQEANARKALREAKELEGPLVTITRALSYGKAVEAEPVIREAILSPRGRVIVDERTNSLIISDIQPRIDAADNLLASLDSETPQVMIEARIVEISRDFTKNLGVSWGFLGRADPALGTQTNLDFPHTGEISYDLNLSTQQVGANALGFSFGNVLDSFNLDITLDALESEGYARRLSSPKIATQNNEQAEVEQGIRFPIVSTTATEIDVRFVAASLRLVVTPQITADGTVVLELEVENNQPDNTIAVGDVPGIATQRAETKVMIPDGGTTVIAGIFTVNEGQSERGVPWFRNLPGLGWLFRTKNWTTNNRELLIFVTPRIIKSS